MTMDDTVLGVRVGDKAEFTKTVTSDDVVAFANVTGDTNPLHLDDAYAAKTRFGRRIAHGMLSAGFISAALGTKLAPHACVVYLSQSLRFQRPVYVGDTVTARVEVTKIDPARRFVTLTTTCANQNGEELLTGEALVLLDPVA
ncbi:MAG TPA: MaoC family dehydratase [Dehalococcoidia bacterium]|jgi:3-hydroxybutyryl-CoA dehydratase|nr:MaoC family dehydratase [Dehalococcoidia bacterium]